MEKDCDLCGEPNAQAVDMYYSTAWWCQDCIDKSADRGPDYSAETAQETYDKAWAQKMEAKG